MEGMELGKVLDLGITAAVVLIVVAPVMRWLMKQVEGSRESFLKALQESNASHQAAVKDLGEKMEQSVKELAHKIEMLAQKVRE